MTINLQLPESDELRPKITVFGVGGAGGNAVNNMIQNGLEGCEFVVANTDAQALSSSQVKRTIQMGVVATEGLGAGSQPEIGRAAAEEAIEDIKNHLTGSHMVFITAGMGGGTGTGAAPIVAQAARDLGILTVGVVTKPFNFEGARRMTTANEGIKTLQSCVDTLIVIPNQNLFRIANDQTTFSDAFAMADQVLFSGVASVTDLMVKEGLINLDFADVRAVMRNMGNAMMGTGESSGDNRAKQAAEEAIANPLLDETSMKGARGLLISISGGQDLTLFEVDEAATRIRQEVDPEANIILGATFDGSLDGLVRVSVVATGIDRVDKQDELLKSHTESDSKTDTLGSVTGNEESDVTSKEGSTDDLVGTEIDSQSEVSSTADPEVTISSFQNGGTSPDREAVNQSADATGDGVNEEASPREPYIPPPPEDPDQPSAQIPNLEDFPPIAQREYHAKVNKVQRQVSTVNPNKDSEKEIEPEKSKAKSLLKRITTGFGRKDADETNEKSLRQQQVKPIVSTSDSNQKPETEIPKPVLQPIQPDGVELAMKSPVIEGGDASKPAELEKTPETQDKDGNLTDEQLEIPAFLRRQSNQ